MRRLVLVVAVVGLLTAGGSAALAQYPDAVGQLQGVPAAATPGESVPLVGEGFAADAVLAIVLMPDAGGDAIELGTTTADAGGAVDTTVVIPADTDPGAYTLTVGGDAVDGGTYALAAGLEIGSSSSGGGSDVLPWVIVGVAVLAAAIGGTVWWRSRATG